MVSIVSLEQGLKVLEGLQGRQTVLSFYSSVLGGVTTERALFTVPMDDHMVHRGHAVFDTCSIKLGKAYGLSKHLDRFLLSAQTCRIPPYASKQRLREIILATIARAGQRQSIYVRFWMSAGRGDFAVTPSSSQSEFYCVVHTLAPSSGGESGGIKEVSVSVPVKCAFLATSKTNNYLVNALAAMEAVERGGTLGLQCDSQGNVAECSIGSIGFVFRDEDEVVHTPKLDKILRSTTLLRAEELYIGSGRFVYQDLPLAVVLERAVEVIGFGGSNVSAIVELNGQVIGTGKPGKVFTKLRELLEHDFEFAGSEFLDDIPI
ncbi:hypothetical protein BASA81_004485 [Batrachochytrium salamandrivorans]|nr:hypothetical protein BASA81_004485 [Batrachochytrium salamandrivorans]